MLIILTITFCLIGLNSKTVIAADNQVTIEAEGNVNYDLESHITTATGHVKATHEKGVITADELIYCVKDGFLDAKGSVTVISNEGIVIGADRLIYDKNSGIAEFDGHVKLNSNDGVTLTAKHLVYNETTGLAIASGGVEMTQKQNSYRTEELAYNLQTGEGSSSGPVSGFIGNNGVGRGINLDGETMEIAAGTTTLRKNVFTRCQRPNREYYITAAKIVYDEDRVKIWHAIVFLHGVPFFYFPYLSHRVGADHLLDLEPGYNSSDGFYITYSYDTPVENGRNWFINGVYKTKDTSIYGGGLVIFQNNFSNRLTVNYNVPVAGERYWNINDNITFYTSLFSIIIDGSQVFSDSKKTEFGFSINSKSWSGPLGSWQGSILARKITANSNLGSKYGGVYSGYRLDFSPIQYLTLSLLRVKPASTLPGEDFQSLLSDYNFRFGSNWLYYLQAPFGKDFSFVMDGSFNSSQDLWIDRNYKIVRKTCCFSICLGWDGIKKSHTFSWSIRL